MRLITTFDDWIDLFRTWRDKLGIDKELMEEYKFEHLFGGVHSDEIEFGAYAGGRKWEKVIEIPDQRVRDALIHLIVYQGDTEFASVEQQKLLLNTAPNTYDLMSMARVMREEMRHGWQMSYLLVKYFGTTGRVEAQKLLSRNADNFERLLNTFNEPIEHWLDFFTYADFIDRDGKFQLKMLSHSAFAPLARSMPPMLREESFHLGTGNNGLRRIIQAGKVPNAIVQKYLNKWIATAYDLFGSSHSSSAHWAYVWGLKGRFDEEVNQDEADLDQLNEYNRTLYHAEVTDLVSRFNKMIAPGETPFRVPDVKFQRAIGEYAGKPYSVTGDLLSPEAYDRHLDDALPNDRDRLLLKDIFKTNDWILAREYTKGSLN
ncbi:MAG: Phenylacetic acid catabolic protein [Candidatus Eisenbacteria bacterium]|nr:Phenylacetic acid catabolic protein [Candidatus Eisenbacteria bacterium]